MREAQSPVIAVIGGSGLYSLSGNTLETRDVDTPYGESPVRLFLEAVEGQSFWFLPRHGREHSLAPHQIPYRAQMWALKESGVRQVFAVNAVGGISDDNGPGQLLVPNQLLDYTWGREHSYFDDLGGLHDHIDFTDPYSENLRRHLIEACESLALPVNREGIYACTQGPRLETRAEVRKLANDGADVVGMTGMPEAALARELRLEYACLTLVVNRAAGLGEDIITLQEIRQNLEQGMEGVRAVLRKLLGSNYFRDN